MYSRRSGDRIDAISEAVARSNFDPLSPIVNARPRMAFALRRQRLEAIAQFKKTLEFDANSVVGSSGSGDRLQRRTGSTIKPSPS
jgi:hypothetical protein